MPDLATRSLASVCVRVSFELVPPMSVEITMRSRCVRTVGTPLPFYGLSDRPRDRMAICGGNSARWVEPRVRAELQDKKSRSQLRPAHPLSVRGRLSGRESPETQTKIMYVASIKRVQVFRYRPSGNIPLARPYKRTLMKPQNIQRSISVGSGNIPLRGRIRAAML